MFFSCPHCQQSAFSRKVEAVSPVALSVLYQCPEPECGHTFEVLAKASHSTTPSATPDPYIAELLHRSGTKRAAPGAPVESPA